MRTSMSFGVWLVVFINLVNGQVIAQGHQNHFASILVDGKKIGQLQVTSKHGEQGELEELKTRASYSVFGVEVYHHTMHVHEVWKNGELQSLKVNADQNGAEYDLSLARKASDYQGVLNDKDKTLPLTTFPTSIWHYAITKQLLLFNVPEVKLLKIRVSRSEDTVSLGKKSVPAEKFVFSGDWDATIWFDQNKNFLKAEHHIKGHKLVIALDP